MIETHPNLTIAIIILTAGTLGGLTNFFLFYNFKLNCRENWIKLFAAVSLSLCASLTVPLFLQILSNNLLDNVNFKNALIFTGFCIVASFFSKRFLEDVYAKLNKLDRKVDETKHETNQKIENVSVKTERVIKKVEDLEESSEEPEEIDSIPTEIKDSILKYKANLLADTELEKIVKALFSNNYSFRTLHGIANETSVAKEKVKEILTHLVDHGFAERKVGTEGKDLWRILKYPVRIYSASYGQVDVTDKIKTLVAKGVYHAQVTFTTFGIEDPAPGVVKSLKIHCRIHGQERELIFHDGQMFRIE
jgi:hypothetical protein